VSAGGVRHPLDAFAKLKLLQLTHSDTNHVRSAWSPSPEDLCSNIIYQPSFLTPRLLTEMAGYLPKDKLQYWHSLWDEHETARALYAAASPLLSHLAAGVRPSSGAASFETGGASEKRVTPVAGELAAPEDGRTPLQKNALPCCSLPLC
jgi:hypothetical protein